MANALYDNGRNKFLNGDIDFINDEIIAILIDTGNYTVNLSTDEYLLDIPSAARVGEQVLTGKTASNGIADADDTVYTSATGNSIEAIVLFKNTGNENDSPLIAYIDTATGLPATPDGSDITISWDDGANKIFKL